MRQLQTIHLISIVQVKQETRIAYLPCIAQWHHVINVNITCGRPSGSIIWTEPASARASARRVRDYIRAITLQDLFTRVASARLGDPVREQVARIAGLRPLSCDGQASKLRPCFAGRGNVGRCASGKVEWCWSRRNEGHGCNSNEDRRLHDCCQYLLSKGNLELVAGS
jgi:hypothetical protein